ncbi:MAG: CAP domain-containing protein [Polyangiales bacterium]
MAVGASRVCAWILLSASALQRPGAARADELPCRLDGRLLPAARAASLDAAPDATALRALTEAAHMRAPEVLSWRASGGDVAARDARLRAWITSRAPSPGSPRCAVVIDGEVTAAALVPRLAEVVDEPAEGGRSVWRAALPAGAASPQLVVAPDRGRIARVAVDAEGRARVRVEGGATVQLVLERAGDPQVWARWRVGPSAQEPAPHVEDDVHVRREVNLLRARAGVSALRADPFAASIARDRAREMARSRRVAHVIEGEDPVDSLARAGLRAGTVVELVGRAPTLAGAFTAIFTSPTHRERLEEPSVDALGVGTARADAQVYLVVILLSRPSLGGALR